MKKVPLKISVVIPCLNEEGAIGGCVGRIKSLRCTVYGLRLQTEIIVVDNGSTDRSREVAKKAGAKVILESRKGYGRALLTGLSAAKGDYLFFADGDGSYDFGEVPKLLFELAGLPADLSAETLVEAEAKSDLAKAGPVTRHSSDILKMGPAGRVSSAFDMVIGSRLQGKIDKGAMPFLHRYIGTPLINLLFRIFFKQEISDINSGFRGITKKAFGKLRLYSTGMEFASEMIYKAQKAGLRIGEVPITYKKRIGVSKLSTFRDAWRHIKFMLLFSPGWLFVLPGMLIGGFGVFGLLGLLGGRVFFFGRYFDIHTMTVCAFMVLLGFQIVFLGLFAKVFAVNFLGEKDEKTTGVMQKITLEKGIMFGCLLLAAGLWLFLNTFIQWANSNFGALSMERIILVSLTLIVLGIEIVFSSFFFGLLGREER